MRAGPTALMLGGITAVLAANRAAVGREARSARASGAGRLVPTREGELHVLEEGDRAAPAAVLLHGFAGSMHWFDRLAPLLAADHRVVRVDLLGHGGSAKPLCDYSVERQAAAVAEALERLDVHAALFVGHSFGAAVAVAVAEHRRELVERLVILDEGPNGDFGEEPLMTRIGFLPVLGELMHRLAFDAAIRDGYKDAFGPGFDLSGEVGDTVVRGFRAMTFPAYRRSWAQEQAFLAERRLDERVRALGIPAVAVFGEEDRFFHARRCAEAFAALPDVRAEVLPGVGHSPNVERPEEVARLVRELAAVAAAR